MNRIGKELSRRDFARLLGVGAAAAGLSPVAGMAGDAASLARPRARPAAAAEPAQELVRLNANENPLGPCPSAVTAMREALAGACRYPARSTSALQEEVAAFHGVTPEEILLGNGSSEILELSVAAFCGAASPLVAAEPTFEAVLLHANAVGDKALLVPLAGDYRHDLPKMLAAAPAAGLIYVCNPNNPTATITPKAEVRAFLAQVPRRTMVLVDEAYYHYADSADYESVIPLVREHPNLVVARTFSKIYGMAGVRLGYAVAAPAALARLQQHQAFNNLNIVAVAGARESLKDLDHVAFGRRVTQAARSAACADLDGMGYRTLPSQANFFLVDLRRPAAPVIQALREQGVAVGRPFAAVPRFLRVTVGTADQMRAFGAAFRKVTA